MKSIKLYLSTLIMASIVLASCDKEQTSLSITSFSPIKAGRGDTLTIIGKNFSIIADRNIVTLNNVPVVVESASSTEIKIIVPKNKNCSGAVRVTVANETVVIDEQFTYLLTLTITTLAGGNREGGFADGIGEKAQFDWPQGVAVDASGNVFVADLRNNCIRKITPEGEVSTFAGNGTEIGGFADGMGVYARFRWPYGLAVDASGNVLVADYYNHRIRKITPEGEVCTFAGSGTQGFADGMGISAQFNGPSGLTIDEAGNVYVADRDNNRIRKISPKGSVGTLAGSGALGYSDGISTVAKFQQPEGVAVDVFGNVYVADSNNARIRKISTEGMVSTFAGSGTQGYLDGVGSVAKFHYPRDIIIDASNNLYVADYYNNCIRKITPEREVSTFAGRVEDFFDYEFIYSRFEGASSVAIDSFGNMYVADARKNRICKVAME